MVIEALSRVKSFLRGPNRNPQCSVEIMAEGQVSLKAELVGITSNRSPRLRWMILELGPPLEGLKVTCTSSVAELIASARVTRYADGRFRRREWDVTGYNKEFPVCCQNGTERFEATAILRRV